MPTANVDARKMCVTTRQIRHRRRAVHLLLGGGGGHSSKLRSLTLTLRFAVNLMGDRFGERARAEQFSSRHGLFLDGGKRGRSLEMCRLSSLLSFFKPRGWQPLTYSDAGVQPFSTGPWLYVKPCIHIH